MSVRTMARVWADSSHNGTELLMLLAIADFADDDGRAYPSVAGLATKCRMKPRNANYILAALQESGELRLRHNEGPRGTNLYQIVFSAMRHPFAEDKQPLQVTAPLQATAGVQASAGLQRSAPTPAMQCAKPLQPIADEPSLNHQEPPKKARKRAAVSQVVPNKMLPDWLPLEAWLAFVEMRVSVRKPMTAKAQEMMIRKLERLREEGEDIRAVLEQSVMGSWTTVYRVKSDTRSSSGVMDATEQFRGAI